MTVAGQYVGADYGKVDKKPLGLSFSSEVITGWRAWSIEKYARRGDVTEDRLRALGVAHTWEPYEARPSICITKGYHESPWPDCMCGYWAFKDRDHVVDALYNNYGGEKGKVIGQIALWGRVLECEHGYRGEYGYPLTLQFIDVTDQVAQDVANRYGVPYSLATTTPRVRDCEGLITNTDWDFDRLYANIEYKCGTKVRAEISRLWEGGKRTLDLKDVPPCPTHNN